VSQDRLRRVFFLAVCFALLTIGWESNVAMSSAKKIVVKAETMAEGICLTLENIPPETNWILVQFSDLGKNENLTESHEIFCTSADIIGDPLDHVKETGRIICPFVQTGHVYSIGVYFQIGYELDNSEWIYEKCTAGRGIYCIGGTNLSLNTAQTGVALSSEPEFSAEVQYAFHKFSYSATIKIAEDWMVDIGDNKSANGLLWNFEPELTNELRAGVYLESGDYPAYVSAFCNLIHGEILWSVEIAKSREFTFSL